MNVNLKTIATFTTIAAGVSGAAAAFWFYKNHIWKPKVSVEQVDYASGIASIVVNGKPQRLYAGSTVAAGGEWGVRFGGSRVRGMEVLSRIEVVRKEMVFSLADDTQGVQNK